MAILKVSKSLKHRDNYEVRFNTDKNINEGRYVETWIVQTDDAVVNTITAVEVGNATAGGNTIPTSGLFYSVGGVILRCTSVYPTRESQGGAVWAVRVEYTQPVVTPLNTDKWEIDIGIDGNKVQETVNKDRNGKAIVNSANVPFRNPPPKTYYDEKITVSYKTKDANSELFALLRGKVNSAPVNFTIKGETRTFNRRQMLLDEARISTTYDGVDSDTVFKIDLELLCRSGKVKVYDETGTQKTVDNTFVNRIMDAGQERIPTAGELSASPATGARIGLMKIRDLQGKEVTTDVPMDGLGRGIFGTFNPRYFTFEIEDEADLNQIFDGVQD